MHATADDLEWLATQFDGLTTEIEVLSPSQWAEKKRYLPKEMTSIPGPFRFEVTPYHREILDCLSPESPIREVAVMKGVQICATTALLENYIGYCVDHIRAVPVMFVTADAELAKLRLENNVIRMLQLSGLDDLIRSSDENNPRKTGQTDKKVEWIGGGFLIPFGAKNAAKLRSIPIEVLLRDEVDAFPLMVGRDGDPMKLSEDRTAAFEHTRKILDLSTPTIEGASAIARRFERGDKRRYFVRCLKCSFPQTLRFRRVSKDGVISGMMWEETEHGNLVPGSVRYHCSECGHPHTNEDKTKLLSPAHGAEWIPTAVPVSPAVRSYHLSALYSPANMQTWEACVRKWKEAWDERAGVAKDNEVLQVFYNNVLGEPFRVTGNKIKFEQVSSHRRSVYRRGQIPNKFAAKFAGSPALLLTCTVDVHEDNLAVAVYAWCRDRRPFLVQYERFWGPTEDHNEPRTWGRVAALIDAQPYARADDGKEYRIAITLVDSGYRQETVFSFCQQWDMGVHPIRGMGLTAAAKQSEFDEFTTSMGAIGYGIKVDLYKERWGAALKRQWDGLSQQPEGHYNAPVDIEDRELKELTVETRVERRDKLTKKLLGFEWRRPHGADNEMWDLLVYASAAFDIVAWTYCKFTLELEATNLFEFYHRCETEQLFFSE